ncbi:NAD(P)H-hydrate dehydratase [Falsiroseomonas sp.]|uniref:NAD(P)H-hydrate dehydratase n=1 Tax=Falsiroseomonas sp. TaxID=2870721 RepID=UPI003F71478E
MSALKDRTTAVTADLLRGMPLPRHADGEDKDQRGRVLVVGGSLEVPGGALLAGLAALRAGAGKLQIATSRSVAPALAVAIPEARVLGLRETPDGAIAAEAAAQLAARCGACDAMVIGPGMMDPEAASGLVQGVLEGSAASAFVLDAAALHALDACTPLGRHAGRVVLTPHAGEMARLLGVAREAVQADPLEAARQAARRLQVVVAMKGGSTHVVTPQGHAWRCDLGQVGLATSGSGDTLAGLIGGLLARGAPPLAATLWGVFLHAEAGAALASRRGRIGFLARELLAEIPPIMQRMEVG